MLDARGCACLADRPFTDSEVRFLRYIRQWGKKVVFLVNKTDILSGAGEVLGRCPSPPSRKQPFTDRVHKLIAYG